MLHWKSMWQTGSGPFQNFIGSIGRDQYLLDGTSNRFGKENGVKTLLWTFVVNGTITMEGDETSSWNWNQKLVVLAPWDRRNQISADLHHYMGAMLLVTANVGIPRELGIASSQHKLCKCTSHVTCTLLHWKVCASLLYWCCTMCVCILHCAVLYLCNTLYTLLLLYYTLLL